MVSLIPAVRRWLQLGVDAAQMVEISSSAANITNIFTLHGSPSFNIRRDTVVPSIQVAITTAAVLGGATTSLLDLLELGLDASGKALQIKLTPLHAVGLVLCSGIFRAKLPFYKVGSRFCSLKLSYLSHLTTQLCLLRAYLPRCVAWGMIRMIILAPKQKRCTQKRMQSPYTHSIPLHNQYIDSRTLAASLQPKTACLQGKSFWRWGSGQ